MTDDEMRLWAMNNYCPLHQDVAPGEPLSIALAIGKVLTEVECAPAQAPLSRSVASSALAYINSTVTETPTEEATFYGAVHESARSNE
jgi:hypothetical protein